MPPGLETARLQPAIVAFFAANVAILLATAAAAPEVYERMLGGRGAEGRGLWALVGAIVGLVALLSLGTLRAWRWVFWLELVAFWSAAIGIPLDLAGLARDPGGDFPLWYAAIRLASAFAELALAVSLTRLYRRSGVWGRAAERVAGP